MSTQGVGPGPQGAGPCPEGRDLHLQASQWRTLTPSPLEQSLVFEGRGRCPQDFEGGALSLGGGP